MTRRSVRAYRPQRLRESTRNVLARQMEKKLIEQLEELRLLGVEVSILHPDEVFIDAHDSLLSDKQMELIGKARGLRYLILWGTGVTNTGIQFLSGLPHLEYLEIGRTLVDGACLKVIHDLPAIRSLDLEGILGINEHFSALHNHGSLISIDLSYTDIQSRQLVDLLKHSRIEDVTVEGTHVVPDDVIHLDEKDADPERMVCVRFGSESRLYLTMSAKPEPE